MKKCLCLFLTLIIFLSFISCGKDSGESSTIKYFFRGTIYLRSVPVEGVKVKMEYRDSSGQSGVTWFMHNQEATTDSDGKYEFILEKSIGATTTSSWQFKIKVLHPETNEWVPTAWKLGGSATRGESGATTLNFNLE